MRKTLSGLLIGALFLSAGLNAQTAPKKKGPVGVSGWVTFWDEGHRSIASFEKHADQIDRAYFELYKCQPDGLPARIKDATPELLARVKAAAAKNNVETWFTTGNFDVSLGYHNKNWIEKFLYDDALRAKHIQMLVGFAKQDGLNGVQIDYENLLAKDKGAFSDFMTELGKACKANGLLLGIALPPKVDASGTWDDPQSRDYGAIGKATDQFVPMTYDLHWSTSTAGCVTSPEWAEMVIKYSASVMEPQRLEVGYPAYGYDWVGNKGESITWPKFQELVGKYKLTPVRDTDYSQELHIAYTDEKGQSHEAWMPDSVSLEHQADIVKRNKLYGLGVWFFGSEGESFWTALKMINSTAAETKGTVTASMNPYAAQASTASVALDVKDFLTDKAGADYAYAYPPGGSKITVVEKQGKRWVDAALKGNAWAGFGAGTSRKNLEPYLAKGALQFYIRGAKGGENPTFGFLMDTGLGPDEKVHLQTAVTIANYAKVTTQWQLVTIPLSEFPNTGGHFDDNIGQRVHGPFKWSKVMEWGCDTPPGSDAVCEIFLSSVRVVPTYDVKAVERAKFKALQ